MKFVEEYKDEHGVQPICEALKGTGYEIAPSTYYHSRKKTMSARHRSDLSTTNPYHAYLPGELPSVRYKENLSRTT